LFQDTKAVELEKASSEQKGTAQFVLEIEDDLCVERAVVLILACILLYVERFLFA